MDAPALFAAGAATGLLAGVTTCAAVQLGLLTGAIRDTERPSGPVAAFLTARLGAHTCLGAVLGMVGGAVQPGPRVRGALLALAAVALLLFALDLLGVRPVRRLLPRHGDTCHAPAAGAASAEVDRPSCHAAGSPGADGSAPSTRRPGSGSRWRPAALGAATVLLPCGLTLSAELMAVASRSPVGGAAVMAGFVMGGAPVFGLVGVALGRLRGRLTPLVAVALLAVAGWTLLSGLRLGGWMPAGGGGDTAAADASAVHVDASGRQIVTIWALDRGYRPAVVAARAGVPTVLVLRTADTRGHTRAFTIPSRDVDIVLPVNGDTRVDLGAPRAGRLNFVCASGHYPGSITFR
ncbi:sulfite exporter TauE/SafE family protein [Actinomadura miaoliensis]|uniref:Sulfite exporter TauE/SafE family protein n=1 Tax=Actinomadura miaoliensis TaxID=430685 RepID=A0ABP7W4S0_9ACTN